MLKIHNFAIDTAPLTDTEINSAKSAIRNNLALVVDCTFLTAIFVFFGFALFQGDDTEIITVVVAFSGVLLGSLSAAVKITGFNGFPASIDGCRCSPWDIEAELDPIQPTQCAKILKWAGECPEIKVYIAKTNSTTGRQLVRAEYTMLEEFFEAKDARQACSELSKI